MAYYATMLGQDEELRKQIGKEGKLSTIADFDPLVRRQKYTEIYKMQKKRPKMRVPFLYRMKFYFQNKQQAKEYICGILRITFPKAYDLYLKIK